MSRPRARRAPTRRRTARIPLRTLLILFFLGAVILSALVCVSAYVWTQPQFAPLRADILRALAPITPTPAPTDAPSAGATPATAEVPGWYHVYFTEPRYPDVESERGAGIDAHLVQLIGSAQHSVDVAAYELDLETVADALLAAQARGVAVRLVTDTDNLEEPAVERLAKGGVPVREDGRSAIMHNKFIIIDGRYLWTGSWNLTVNCTYRNNNNAIVIASPDLAANYQREFDEMFGSQSFGPRSPTSAAPAQVTVHGTAIECYFAPEDGIAERLVELVSQAEESVHFMAFSFTDEALAQALIERHQAGVSVSGVMEKRGSTTQYAQLPPLQEAGVEVLQDGNPYVMHHKVLIIDGETVVTGSFNFSQSANESNDENVLIIRHRDIAAQFLAEFERVHQQAVEAQEE